MTTRQKKFRWLTAVRFVGEHSWLLVAVNVVLFCCCFDLASCLGHLKGKCMTKLMKVCIGNNQRTASWKCTSTGTLDKNKKTLILVFRCWHYKNKRTKSAEIVWGQWMWCLFSIVFVFKLSIRFVALSSLYSKLRFSLVAPNHTDHWRSFQNFNWQQNVKVWNSNTSSTFVYL